MSKETAHSNLNNPEKYNRRERERERERESDCSLEITKFDKKSPSDNQVMIPNARFLSEQLSMMTVVHWVEIG